MQPAPVQPVQLKRKPGRPRKIIIEPEDQDEAQPAKPKRGPGRPRKVIVPTNLDAHYHQENEKNDDTVDVDISGHLKKIDLSIEGENDAGYDTEVVMSVEQDDR